MDIFFEISLILVIATLVALVMQRLRQPLIVGHIISGILVGPLVLNIVRSRDTIEVFSKLGITTLLFLVGIGLSPRVMREVGKVSVVIGVGQVVFTALFGFLLGRLLGFSLVPALYVAAALTFSSTIVVLKLLSDKQELGKLHGKIAVGLLLVQDVIATLLLIVLSGSGRGWPSSDALTAGIMNAAFLIALLIILVRLILPALAKSFAASQEFLLLFSIGWGLGIAALFQAFGFSTEIGALAAGIALASSPYQHEISAKMKIFRDFFIVLFFILLGSQLSFAHAANLVPSVIIFSLFVLIGNPLIVMILMGFMGYHRKTGFMTGIAIAQISEFSFLLVTLGVRLGHISTETVSLVTLVGLITIAGSTYLVRYSEQLYTMLAPMLKIFERKHPIQERHVKKRFDVILFGYHRVGMDFLSSLLKTKKRFLVVDFDPEVIRTLEARHIPCRYGDAGDDEFLDDLDFTSLEMLVSTIPDFEVNSLLLEKLRRINRKAAAIVTARQIAEATQLYERGASYVILPHFLGGNYAALLVEKLGTNAQKFAAERKRHLEHLRHKLPLAQQSPSRVH